MIFVMGFWWIRNSDSYSTTDGIPLWHRSCGQDAAAPRWASIPSWAQTWVGYHIGPQGVGKNDEKLAFLWIKIDQISRNLPKIGKWLKMIRISWMMLDLHGFAAIVLLDKHVTTSWAPSFWTPGAPRSPNDRHDARHVAECLITAKSLLFNKHVQYLALWFVCPSVWSKNLSFYLGNR